MKKILILHTGGTFGMVNLEPDETLAPGNLQEEFLNRVPELSKIADIDVRIPYNEDSSNLGMAEWNNLANIIHQKMDNYDGFIVINGTDTMVYTATAISFSLLNLSKPVVFTGAQRPLAKLRSDARSNLIDALEVATLNFGEVVIVFGQQILRANRARKTSKSNYDAFYSPNYPLIGQIGLNVEIKHRNLFEKKREYSYFPGFDPAVMSIHIFPESNPEFFNEILKNKDIRVLMLIGFGAGNLPFKHKGWIGFIKKAYDAGKAIFINTSSAHGSIRLNIYESGKKAMQAGAKGCEDMTIEASLVKIMKSLKYSENREEIYQQYYTNLAGEVSLENAV